MALGNIPLLWCTASPCCPLCPSAMHHVGLVKWRSENETWREIHPLVYDIGYFASSNYLSLRTPYFSPMFLCIYLNIIANTVQNFQTEILHVNLQNQDQKRRKESVCKDPTWEVWSASSRSSTTATIKARIRLKIIIEHPSKRSWAIAMSVLMIC